MADVKCLTPDMMLKLSSGSLVKAGDIKVGALITTPEGDTRVVKVINPHEREGVVVINNELGITGDHPMLTEGNTFIPAKDIQLGDSISGITLESKKWKQGKMNTVYIET